MNDDHEPSEPPAPTDRLASLPGPRSVTATGAWPAAEPGSLEHVAAHAYSARRRVLELQVEVGTPAIPAKGLVATGLYLTIELGFAAIERRLAAQDASALARDVKIDAVLARDAAVADVRERRGKTAADLTLTVVKAVLLSAVFAAGGFLFAHFRW